MRRYIDEYLDSCSGLIHTPEDIKNKIISLHNGGKSIDDIVEYLMEWLYIFKYDEEEQEYYKEVVTNFIEGKPVVNRFTKEIFE